MPVVDSQNHEPAPLSSAAAADVAALGLGWLAEPPHAGPATRVEFAAGGARWVATRRVPAGCPVTWRCAGCCSSSLYAQPDAPPACRSSPSSRSYGALSNESLLLQFGFVPWPPLHGDAAALLALPESVFAEALLRGDAAGGEREPAVAAAREALLQRAGALGMAPGEEAAFELRPGEAPEALLAVAGVVAVRSAREAALYDTAAGEGDAALKAEHAARAAAFAARLLRAAAAQWCGPPEADDPAGLMQPGAAPQAEDDDATSSFVTVPDGTGAALAVPRRRARAAAALRSATRAVFAAAAAAAERATDVPLIRMFDDPR